MNLSKALLLFCSLAAPTTGSVNTQADRFHEMSSGGGEVFLGNSLWVFGDTGIHMYNPDGSRLLNSVEPKDICHMTAGYSGEDAASLSCSFYDIVSDGKKYVWAAVSRGVPKVDILDIDTGAVVGSFETSCDSPRQLEYHALRDEIWVRCSDVDDDSTPSYLDVFSASSPSVDIQTNILPQSNSSMSSRGYSVIDHTLGDVGYTTDRNMPFLFKMDLSDKVVTDQIELPNAHGGYEVAYSQANGHIFVRSTVCCTCGFEGADNGVDCGRYGADNVTITTGPFAGSENISGQCGRCDGMVGVDTLGVYEVDTATDTIVGNHLMQEGYGGDPFPSPDGKHIVLIAKNGGTSVRILRTGEPGQKSTVYADLELGFDNVDLEDEDIFNDYAFIERGGKSFIIFVAGTENKMAIVDMTTSVPEVDYLTLSQGNLTSYRERRQVEWAVGTDYVWVDGTAAEPHEIYVVDFMKGVIVRTITGVATTKMVSVNNYERLNQMEMQSRYSQTMSAASGESTTSDSGSNVVAVVGLILGVIALAIGAMNFVFLNKILAATKGDSSIKTGNEDVSLTSIK